MKPYVPDRPGAMLLITIIILGAVALTISLELALRSIGEVEMGFAQNQSQQTFTIAESCTEDALRHLWADYSYTGATLNIGNGSCSIEVSSDGTKRVIAVEATLDRWTRRIATQVNLTSTGVTLLKWQQNTPGN